MGNEAECSARYGEQRGKGRALLETKELIFRGDFRAVFPFAEMKGLRADDGRLAFEHRGQPAELELGPLAAKWAEKIKNPRSRIDKLGIKPGQRVAVVGVDDATLLSELAARGAQVTSGKPKDCDAIFLGVSSKADLRKIAALKSSLKKDGALWLIRPKGANAPVGELETMAAGKKAGLVDIKVVAFSQTHSAENFVIPVAKR